MSHLISNCNRSLFRYIALVAGALCLFGCSSGNGNDNDSLLPPEQNIIVTAVDVDGQALGLDFIRWGFVDIDGNVANWSSVFCSSSDDTQQCESIPVGFEADGEIRIGGLSTLEIEGLTCTQYVEGYKDVTANPTIEQFVELVLNEFGGVCP